MDKHPTHPSLNCFLSHSKGNQVQTFIITRVTQSQKIIYPREDFLSESVIICPIQRNRKVGIYFATSIIFLPLKI